MVKIVELAVGDVKPDPKQPRTFINKEKVKEMAMSMKTEGIIKPIEIDGNNTIITGELRWRAAKEAGLTTIPCIQRDITGRERFRRQLIENLHNSSMTAIDTARAIKILLPSGDRDAAVSHLANEIGTNRAFIMEHLDILETLPELQRRIKENKLPRTITRAIKMVPSKYRDSFQKKILKENLGRDVAVHLSKAMHFHPDMAKELLSRDYAGKKYVDVAKELDAETPALSTHIERSNNMERELHKHVSAIIKWMAENNLEDVGPVYQELIKSDFRLLSRNVTKWAAKQGLLGSGDDTKKLK